MGSTLRRQRQRQGRGGGGGVASLPRSSFMSMKYASKRLLYVSGEKIRNGRTTRSSPLPTATIRPGSVPPPGREGGWREEPACCCRAAQTLRTADMRRMFSVAQMPLATSPTNSALSQVPSPVVKFSQPPLPTNARVGTTKTMTDNILIYDKF